MSRLLSLSRSLSRSLVFSRSRSRSRSLSRSLSLSLSLSFSFSRSRRSLSRSRSLSLSLLSLSSSSRSFSFFPFSSSSFCRSPTGMKMKENVTSNKNTQEIYIKRIINAQDISTWNILTPCAKHAHILSRLLVGASEEVLLSLMFPLENWGSWQD